MDYDDIPEVPPLDAKERELWMYRMMRRSLKVAMEYERITQTAKVIMAVLSVVAGAIATGLVLWKALIEWAKH